uniref:Uncharacterized protein n=1 Tax=Anguilla anguilla TaxID=7936 RepID=A0A0E9WZL7_ANGAN
MSTLKIAELRSGACALRRGKQTLILRLAGDFLGISGYGTRAFCNQDFPKLNTLVS